MRTRAVAGLLVLVVASCSTSAQPSAPPAVELTEERVSGSLHAAGRFLLDRRRDDGSWETPGPHKDAPTAAAVRALIEAGARGSQSPDLDKSREWLASHREVNPLSLALRIRARMYFAKGPLPESGQQHKADIEAILGIVERDDFARADGQTTGRPNPAAFWAVYGLADAMDQPMGDEPHWRKLLAFWVKRQNADGGWGYGEKDASNFAMTAAAAYAVHTCDRVLRLLNPPKSEKADTFPPGDRAMAWLDRHFAEFIDEGKHRGSDDLATCLLYLHHAATATGCWRLAGREVYPAICRALLRAQQADGSWPGASPVLATAFAVRVLAAARAPVVLARLQYDGPLSRRPHAVANLMAWMGPFLCYPPFGWRTVGIDDPPEAWAAAPMLLIAGTSTLKLTDAQRGRLRLFVERGGAILSCSEDHSLEFRVSIQRLYAQLFPAYPLAECAPEHRVYHAFFQLKAKPKLWAVFNGARLLAVHCDEDLTLPWQQERVETRRDAFEVFTNVFLVSQCDSLRALPPRWGEPWPTETQFEPKATVRVARLKHAGNCDPEPLAYERFGRLMGGQLRVKIDVQGPMPIDELAKSGAKLAALSGTGELKLTDAEQAAIKKHVAAGGTLLVEAVGGDEAFGKSAAAMLAAMYGEKALQRLDINHPLYRIKGLEITRVDFTRAMWRRDGYVLDRQPRLCGAEVDGRLAVVFSEQDITAALLGRSFGMSAGNRPDSAFEILRNVVLYAGGVAAEP